MDHILTAGKQEQQGGVSPAGYRGKVKLTDPMGLTYLHKMNYP